MIEPLVNEAEWLAEFRVPPLWHPPENPMLVIAPHPDDETLGAGGLIRRQRLHGVDVTVVAVTDGERAYADADGLRAVRRAEQTEALAQLGVSSDKIIRLELPDSAVREREEELVARLSSLVTKDTHVVAPWKYDFHPDHEACGRAAERVAGEAGAKLTSYFFWSWHYATVALMQSLGLRQFSMTTELAREKWAALQCHRSQLVRAGEEPILPDRLLGPAKRCFELFATS